MQRLNSIKTLKPSVKLVLIAVVIIFSVFIFCSSSICNTKKAISKKQIISSKLNNTRMDVLYKRFISKSNKYQLCLLHLPSNKVDKLFDAQKFKLLGATIGDTVFSPDGSKLLFTASVFNGKIKQEKDEDDVWLYNLKTNKLSRITRDSQGYIKPTWSPDNRYIFANGLNFWRQPEMPIADHTERNDRLYVFDTRTDKKWLITEHASYNNMWSSDGKYLFAINELGYLIVYNTHLRKKTLLSKKSGESATWIKNSENLLYTSGTDDSIFCISKSGENKTFLSKSLNHVFFSDWSSNGSQVIFHYPDLRELMVFDINKRKSKNILSNVYEYTCEWSPKGNEIAVAFHGLTHNDPYKTKIVVINTVSLETRNIKSLPDKAEILGWSNNGKSIILLNTTFRRIKKNDEYIGMTANPQKIIIVDVEKKSKDRIYNIPVPMYIRILN